MLMTGPEPRKPTPPGGLTVTLIAATVVYLTIATLATIGLDRLLQ